MAIITTGPGSSFDVYETAISSALVPTVTWLSPSRIQVQFPGGFSDTLSGTGLSTDEDGTITDGLIYSVVELREGIQSFNIEGMSLPATVLNDWFSDGDYMSFFARVLQGNDVITGGSYSDRMAGYDGLDLLDGGDGNDVLEGGAGDDTLIGGSGGDYIYGDSGNDTAVYAGLNAHFSISFGSEYDYVTDRIYGSIDTLEQVETIKFLDGTLTFDPESSAAKIARLYDAAFQSPITEGALDYWLDLVHDQKMLLADVAKQFTSYLLQGEGDAANLSNASFVELLYNRVLGRAADPGGRAAWTGALDAGLARSDAFFLISESTEHRGRTSSHLDHGLFETDDGYQIVALLYDAFANRLPDAGGLVAWAEALNSKAMTLQQISEGFASSAEFTQHTVGMNNAELVDYMYRSALDREADAGGKAAWVNALDYGMTRGELILGFSQSAEHQSLYQYHIVGGIDVAL